METVRSRRLGKSLQLSLTWLSPISMMPASSLRTRILRPFLTAPSFGKEVQMHEKLTYVILISPMAHPAPLNGPPPSHAFLSPQPPTESDFLIQEWHLVLFGVCFCRFSPCHFLDVAQSNFDDACFVFLFGLFCFELFSFVCFVSCCFVYVCVCFWFVYLMLCSIFQLTWWPITSNEVPLNLLPI